MNMQDRDYLDAIVGRLEGIMEERFKSVFEKQDDMIEHQKKTNGRVTKTEDDIRCVKQDSVVSAWVSKHPVQSVVYMVVLMFTVVSLADMITLKDLIQLIK